MKTLRNTFENFSTSLRRRLSTGHTVTSGCEDEPSSGMRGENFTVAGTAGTAALSGQQRFEIFRSFQASRWVTGISCLVRKVHGDVPRGAGDLSVKGARIGVLPRVRQRERPGARAPVPARDFAPLPTILVPVLSRFSWSGEVQSRSLWSGAVQSRSSWPDYCRFSVTSQARRVTAPRPRSPAGPDR
jgi:hypothetical protein